MLTIMVFSAVRWKTVSVVGMNVLGLLGMDSVEGYHVRVVRFGLWVAGWEGQEAEVQIEEGLETVTTPFGL